MKRRIASLVLVLFVALSVPVNLSAQHCPFPATIIYARTICAFFGFGWCDTDTVEVPYWQDPCADVSWLLSCQATYIATCDPCFGCN